MRNRAKYGLPYKGSKNRIADEIINLIPPSNTFIDLFGGGAAIMHAAALSNKYQHLIYNDIDPQTVQYVSKALSDGYNQVSKSWITREEFMEQKETDMYIRYCWSFISAGECYIYPYKKQDLKREAYLNGTGRTEAFERLDRIHRFYTSLKDVKDHITILNLPYEDVIIEDEDTTIYCDIPYEYTSGYHYTLDYEKFYRWAETLPIPVYISSYDIPEKYHFKRIDIKKFNEMESLFLNDTALSKMKRKNEL